MIVTWRGCLRGCQITLQLVKVLTIRWSPPSDYTVAFLCLETAAPGFAGVPQLTQLPGPPLIFFRCLP